MKRTVVDVIIAFLLLSVVCNVALLVFVFQKHPPNAIIGTYCTGNEMSLDDEYFVFMPDASYVRYKQFHVLETGNYRNSDGLLYHLNSSEATIEQNIVFNGKDTIYYFDGDKMILFVLIDSVPFFANLPDFAFT